MTGEEGLPWRCLHFVVHCAHTRSRFPLRPRRWPLPPAPHELRKQPEPLPLCISNEYCGGG